MKPLLVAALAAAALAGCGADETERAGPPPSSLTTEHPAPPPDVGGTSDASQAESRPVEPEPKADEGDFQFTVAMDNDAIAADDLIDRALDGEGVVGSLVKVRERVTRRNNKRLLDGGETRPGVELLRSALASAVSAARVGDLPRLARARADILDARSVISGG